MLPRSLQGSQGGAIKIHGCISTFCAWIMLKCVDACNAMLNGCEESLLLYIFTTVLNALECDTCICVILTL